MKANRLHVSVLAGTVLLMGAGFTGALAPAALAAPVANPGPDKAAAASAAVTPVAAITESEDEAVNCSRSRKRLWVEGEGWIVRRVTICR